MKAGTPGFVGGRLREAREARGLTAISLSGLLGVTRAAISSYEVAGASPHPEVMERIAQVLNLPHSFFLRPLPDPVSEPIFFRSMSTATKSARLGGLHKYVWLKEIVAYILRFVRLPVINFPKLEVPSEPRDLDYQRIEQLATGLRRFWGLGDGPISNVTLLLENNGTIVSRIELGADTLDAFSGWSPADGRPYVFQGADKESAVRSRYDTAHEVGHLILHRDIDRTRLNDPIVFRLLEDQAHRFAGAFLLPSASFADDFYIPTLDMIRSLKPKWIVSIGMMIYRAQELGFVTPEQARRLWINYNRRGWKSREPLDDTIKIEKPCLLRRAFEVLVEKGRMPRQNIISELPFNRADVEKLANLPDGYLDEDSPYVWAITTLSQR